MGPGINWRLCGGAAYTRAYRIYVRIYRETGHTKALSISRARDIRIRVCI